MSFKGGILLKALLWLLLLVCCWPLALVLDLLVWLLTLPFRLVGIAFERVFEPLRAILLLPARVLGGARSWNWAIRGTGVAGLSDVEGSPGMRGRSPFGGIVSSPVRVPPRGGPPRSLLRGDAT